MYDVVSIGKRGAATIVRTQGITSSFGFSYHHFESADELLDAGPGIERTLAMVLSMEEADSGNEIASAVQTAKYAASESYLIVVIGAKLKQTDAEFIKKSGASLVIMENEVIMTSKLEFILSQKVRATHIPIKVSELVPGATIDCNVYHLLALNKKFVPVIRAGEPIKEERLAKLKEYNEVYIQKSSLGAYQTFVKSNQDQSARGLASRCRAQFLSLVAGFTDLLLMISDQSEYTSFEKGRGLYERVLKLADELMGNLGSVGDAWEIISNSAIGDFGSVERSPAVAAYAGLLALNHNLGDHVEVMVGALLSNVGLLDLSPSITRKIRANQQDQFLPEEWEEYKKHPVTSLNQALTRRLPLTDRIKNAIQYSHERTDGRGFPGGLTGNMIPDEAFLIQLCEMIDQESLIKLGEARKKIDEVRKDIFQREYMANRYFSLTFMTKIKESFLH